MSQNNQSQGYQAIDLFAGMNISSSSIEEKKTPAKESEAPPQPSSSGMPGLFAGMNLSKST